MTRDTLSRRHIWKAGFTGLVGGALGGPLGRAEAQVAGQNFDVISWKTFSVPAQDNPPVASTTYVNSNMPANGVFIKQRPDTHLWVICRIHLVPTFAMSCYTAIQVNGVQRLIVALAGPANQLATCEMSDVIGSTVYPAGANNFMVQLATNSNQFTCTWRTSSCVLRVFEIALPAPL